MFPWSWLVLDGLVAGVFIAQLKWFEKKQGDAD
jgi:hypothetical protein